MTTMTSIARILPRLSPLAVLAALAAAPFFVGRFQTFQLATILIWAVAILGVNMLTGFSGQITLASGAFVGIGAYVTSVLAVHAGVDPLLTVLVAAPAGFACGVAVGVPAARLRGIQLIILTAVVAVAFAPVVKRLDALTGGAPGLAVPRPAAPAAWGVSVDAWVLWLSLIPAAAVWYVGAQIARGRIGRTLVAVKELDLAAPALGFDPSRYRIFTFAISSSFCAVAGSMYAWSYGFVAPDAFPLTLSITLLACAVIGGLTSVWGALAGGAVLTLTPYFLGEVSASLTGLLFGAALILLVYVMPGGVAGVLAAARSRLLAARRSGRAGGLRVRGSAAPEGGPNRVSTVDPETQTGGSDVR